jgi:hypothetical protein
MNDEKLLQNSRVNVLKKLQFHYKDSDLRHAANNLFSQERCPLLAVYGSTVYGLR